MSTARKDSTPKSKQAPSRSDIASADRMIRAAHRGAIDLDDLVQDVLAEACRGWTGRAKFSTYALGLANYRAKDHAAKRAREQLTKTGVEEPWRERRGIRVPPAQIARAVAQLVDRGGAHVGVGLLPQLDAVRCIAAYLGREIDKLARMKVGGLRLCDAVGRPVRVPSHFETTLADEIASLSEGRRRRGRPSRHHPTTITTRVGSRRHGPPPFDAAELGKVIVSRDDLHVVDIHRQHELGSAIVRRALALAGIDGRALNRITSSVSRARAEKYDRLMPSAYAALAEIRKQSR